MCIFLVRKEDRRICTADLSALYLLLWQPGVPLDIVEEEKQAQ